MLIPLFVYLYYFICLVNEKNRILEYENEMIHVELADVLISFPRLLLQSLEGFIKKISFRLIIYHSLKFNLKK